MRPAALSSALEREPVAETGVGVDETPAGERTIELRAETAHVNVHRAVAPPEGTPPNAFVDLIAGHHALRVVCKLGEKLQLAHREHQWPAVHKRGVIGGADLQAARGHRRSGIPGAGGSS